jgi:hypothetical protein
MTGLYIYFSSSPLLLDIPSFLSAELMVYRHVQDRSVLEYPECWWMEGTESGASLPVFTVHQDTPVLHCVKEALKASGPVDDGAGDFVDNLSAHKDSVTAVAPGVAPRRDCSKHAVLIIFIGNVVPRDHMLGGQGNTGYGNVEVWHGPKYRCNARIANNLEWIGYHQSLLKILTGVGRWEVKVTHTDIHGYGSWTNSGCCITAASEIPFGICVSHRGGAASLRGPVPDIQYESEPYKRQGDN